MPTELYENLEAPPKAVLAAVDTGEYDVEISLEELRELAKTAGYPVVGTATQKLQSPVAATFMGSGRLLELKDYMEAAEADIIIFDLHIQILFDIRHHITLYKRRLSLACSIKR